MDELLTMCGGPMKLDTFLGFLGGSQGGLSLSSPAYELLCGSKWKKGRSLSWMGNPHCSHITCAGHELQSSSWLGVSPPGWSPERKARHDTGGSIQPWVSLRITS